MSDNNSWDAKRDEVWKRICEAEGAINALQESLVNVKAIAESRISVDEKTALESAQKASDGAAKVAAAVKVVDELSAYINQLERDLPEAVQKSSMLNKCHKSGQESKEKCDTIVAAALDVQKTLNEIFESVKKRADEVNAKISIVDEQVKGIKEARAHSDTDASGVKSNRDESDRVRSEMEELKARFSENITSADQELNELKSSKENELNELIKEKGEALDDLNTDKSDELDKTLKEFREKHDSLINEKRTSIEELCSQAAVSFEELKKKIEDLMPLATSAGLAFAFSDRKNVIEKTKVWWIVGLVLSAASMILLGVGSLFQWFPANVSIMSFAGRSVIVVGLVFIEEFCRRNYNIAARLTESYAYKEVLSTSYIGYKKEMGDMLMPKKSAEDPDVKGSNVLMKILLDKLNEEPGNDVFDKERQTAGIVGLIDAAKDDGSKEADGHGAFNAQFASGKLSTRVTWPVVAFMSIVVVAVISALCFAAKFGLLK